MIFILFTAQNMMRLQRMCILTWLMVQLLVLRIFCPKCKDSMFLISHAMDTNVGLLDVYHFNLHVMDANNTSCLFLSC